MCGVLRGYRAMKDIMTCEICGCSFVDVESEDYTEVFTTGLCCECILEENWGNRMKFKIFNFCKHDYIAMVHVDSDIQNTVFKCSKCSKKYVMSHKEVMKRSKWGNLMKFITDFCLYFAVYTTFWVVTLVFMDKANIYSWAAAIGLAIVTALISNHYNGKHDEWLFCWH